MDKKHPPWDSLLHCLQIPESDELIWDDGSPNPEPCPDVVAPHISEVIPSVLGPRSALSVLLAGVAQA